MPRVKVKPLTNSDKLLSFALESLFTEKIHSPKEWMNEKANLQFLESIDFFSGDQIEESYNKLRKTHYASEKEKIRSSIQTIASQIKANKNKPKKMWAIFYYSYLKRQNPKIQKAEAALLIRNLLVRDFPSDVPKGVAKAGQIPKVDTIRTEWLKEI